ncbi:MAG: hypothetical protein HY914_09290 [Desulfomonile tiedjei]|nr:hypothetical protein [Desulfomonile tiedjei]
MSLEDHEAGIITGLASQEPAVSWLREMKTREQQAMVFRGVLAMALRRTTTAVVRHTLWTHYNVNTTDKELEVLKDRLVALGTFGPSRS